MSYMHETKEYQPFWVKVNKVKVFTGVEVVLLLTGLRPDVETIWTQPVTIDGELCVRIYELEPDSWNIWSKVTSEITDEIVIIYCGNIRIT